MHAFEYHKPGSTKDALSLGKKDEAKYLAGGQSLVQAMKLRLSAPSDLIDLASLKDLQSLKAEGGNVVVGMAGSVDIRLTIRLDAGETLDAADFLFS